MVRPVVLMGLVAAVGFIGPLRAQCPDGSPPPCIRAVARAPVPNSVAVLYFDNLSRDTADSYLADGLTEELITRLGTRRLGRSCLGRALRASERRPHGGRSRGRPSDR